MSLLIRERPPTSLTAHVATPGSGTPPTYRWAADDPAVQNIPDALSFKTTMPGGFDSATLTLNRDPRIDWPDLVELSTITVYGLGGSQVAYQGRIEEFPSQAGSSSTFSPTIAGWQAHLQDTNDAAMVYLDSDMTSWTSPNAARQAAITAANFQLGNSQVAADPMSSPPVPALVQTITDSWASPSKPLCETWYVAPAGCKIAKLYYSVKSDPGVGGAGAWSYQIGSSSDAILSSYQFTGNLSNSSQVTGTFTPGSATGFMLLQFAYGTTPAGAAGGAWNCYWDVLQLIGNHGLTLQGSGPYTLLASDVIAHAVSTWAPKLSYSTGSTGSIQPSSFGIPQLAFGATTPLAIIQQASEYELLDYAVWEGPYGPTFYSNARGARGRQWLSRVGAAQLQNAGPQVSRIYNGVIVSFTAPDGSTQTVGPPGSNTTAQSSNLVDSDPQNPATLAGINRWYLLSMGTTTQAGAEQAGAIFLQEQLAANTSGQATLVGHVQDYATGTWWPAWMVRAGDSIAFVDAADTSFRRIVSTSYEDSTRTNTVQLDQPPDDMSALLDRLSVGLAPIGLS